MTQEIYIAAFRVFFPILIIYFSHFFIFFLNAKVKPRKIGGVTEFLLVVDAIILSVTFLDNWIVYVVGFLTLVCCIISRSSFSTADQHLAFSTEGSNTESAVGRYKCITLCRASVFLITAVCISAVDFPIFPSHLAKSKFCTPGLMDTGIGLFVFSIAVLPKKEKRLDSSLKTLISAAPLLALGVMRTVILKITNYHQDVTEYGLHWNAFLTIAITKLFGDTLSKLAVNKLTLSTIIIILHETALQTGLGNWTVSFEVGRETFLEANREGIISLPGFVAIYLASGHISDIITAGSSTITHELFYQKRKLLIFLTMAVFLILILVIPTSQICRRTANMGYFMWIILIALVMLILFMSLERCAVVVSKTRRDYEVFKLPTITEAVNYNALFFFVISNFLTGLINIFCNTSGRSSLASFMMLNIYMTLVCSPVVYLYKCKKKIKL